MPLYDYRCRECDKVHDELAGFEDKIKLCPHCGGEAHRVITGVPLLKFKGSGFYKTDYSGKESK